MFYFTCDRSLKAMVDESVVVTCADESVREMRQPNNARARQAGYGDDDDNTPVAVSGLRRRRVGRQDPRSTSVCVHGCRVGSGQHCN